MFHRPGVKKGIVDKQCTIKDATLSYTRWSLLQGWFGNKNAHIPICNPWRLDMGKLIVPNMYLDIDLLKANVANYDPIVRVVRTHFG